MRARTQLIDKRKKITIDELEELITKGKYAQNRSTTPVNEERKNSTAVAALRKEAELLEQNGFSVSITATIRISNEEDQSKRNYPSKVGEISDLDAKIGISANRNGVSIAWGLTLGFDWVFRRGGYAVDATTSNEVTGASTDGKIVKVRQASGGYTNASYDADGGSLRTNDLPALIEQCKKMTGAEVGKFKLPQCRPFITETSPIKREDHRAVPTLRIMSAYVMGVVNVNKKGKVIPVTGGDAHPFFQINVSIRSRDSFEIILVGRDGYLVQDNRASVAPTMVSGGELSNYDRDILKEAIAIYTEKTFGSAPSI